MKKALSLFLVLTFVFVMFASVSVNAAVGSTSKDNYATSTLLDSTGANTGLIAARLTAYDTFHYNSGYECVQVTDRVNYYSGFTGGLYNLPVISSVVFIYSDYEIPTVKQANSYVAVTDNRTVCTYVYSEGQYTVRSVYVYHKLNQGDSKVANYSGAMVYNEFIV